MSAPEPPFEGPPPREPALRSPWPAAAIAGLIIALYAVQSAIMDVDSAARAFGFSRADLEAGRWTGLFTALFVHGGWAHAILNALGALAFGAPVARLFGKQASGVIGFLLFFLVCGALASLGFAAVHPDATAPLVGASGAVSGLMGAASRLLDRPEGGLSPFTGSRVVSMAAAWIVINLVVGLVGLNIIGDAPIAWEAHLAGYAAGLALVGPTAWLLGRFAPRA
jgi:membrane associated rhomboid family serine protease